MSQDSNPGAATPYSLYKLYNKQAAATANPFTLRQAAADEDDERSCDLTAPAQQQAAETPLLASCWHSRTPVDP